MKLRNIPTTPAGFKQGNAMNVMANNDGGADQLSAPWPFCGSFPRKTPDRGCAHGDFRGPPLREQHQ
jgi:hypothetical protein